MKESTRTKATEASFWTYHQTSTPGLITKLLHQQTRVTTSKLLFMDIYFVYVFLKTKLQEEEMINNKKIGAKIKTATLSQGHLHRPGLDQGRRAQAKTRFRGLRRRGSWVRVQLPPRGCGRPSRRQEMTGTAALCSPSRERPRSADGDKKHRRTPCGGRECYVVCKID